MSKLKIFVFGSNREGRHGKGAALTARNHHGAIYGQAEGIQGNSYAIITKELRKEFPPITLEEVKRGVDSFLDFARIRQDCDFEVSPIGCGLAGFIPEQIAPLFVKKTPNVHLPPEFTKIINDDPIIAITTNDWHLWPTPPRFRSSEKDWLNVMAGYLEQITNLLPSAPSGVPVVMAGDMFDRFDPPASFISWCMDHIPECYVVAGQHDLPYHRLEDIDKSALGVMIKLGRCKLLSSRSPQPVYHNNLVLHGFSWNQEVRPLKREDNDKRIHLAVIHAYIWTKNTCYPGASEESRLAAWQKKLKGYDAAVFGDNHKSFFITKKGPCPILNTGSFMVRKSDERGHKPSVGILHESGKLTRHYLDISKDNYFDPLEGMESTLRGESDEYAREAIAELEALGDLGLDFKSSVNQWAEVHKVRDSVRKLLLEMME